MNSFTRDHNIFFANEVFFEIAVCMFVLINRMQQTGYPQEEREPDLSALQLDTIGTMVTYVVAELGYASMGRSGILAVEKQILLRSLQPQIQNINDFELYGVVCHFLLEISREIDVDIQSDNLLIDFPCERNEPLE